ncbi:unnamed protein product, partial [Closterium sp. Naga37s-1]
LRKDAYEGSGTGCKGGCHRQHLWQMGGIQSIAASCRHRVAHGCDPIGREIRWRGGGAGGDRCHPGVKRAGFSPHRPIDVLMFTSEEPTRFGIGCLGSRILANQTGYLDRLLALRDKDGRSFAEAAAEAGYGEARNTGSVAAVALGREQVGAFVELHIEQGPLLEEQGLDIGIVTAIAAPATLMVDFSGGGGHAGALLMKHRNDAGYSAGHLMLQPNAVNSVPRHARLEIDIRDIDEARRDGVVSKVVDAARRIAARRKVKVERMELVNADPPAQCSSMVTSAVLSAVQELGLSHQRMVSRAYHDALFMARVAPTGMVFIPCRGGVSHRPDEFTSKLEYYWQVLNLTKVLELGCEHLPIVHIQGRVPWQVLNLISSVRVLALTLTKPSLPSLIFLLVLLPPCSPQE